MAAADWFRKASWSEADAADFHARLGRSRSAFHRAQYCRIQALTLFSVGDLPSARTALELLQKIFVEFPERSELSGTHLLAAECHERLGNVEQAIEHYRLSLHAQANYPNRDSGVKLAFPWFVARNNFVAQYQVALQVLDEAHIAFPVQQFQAAATRAFVAKARGDGDAAQHALEALDAARLDQSQFRYHRGLGLVGEEYEPYLDRLRSIAAA